MSLDVEGNFMAKWGEKTMAPNWFNNDLSRSTLYEMLAYRRRYRILLARLYILYSQTWCKELCIPAYLLSTQRILRFNHHMVGSQPLVSAYF